MGLQRGPLSLHEDSQRKIVQRELKASNNLIQFWQATINSITKHILYKRKVIESLHQRET